MELCKYGIPSRNDYHYKNRIEILYKKTFFTAPHVYSRADFLGNYWNYRTLAWMSTQRTLAWISSLIHCFCTMCSLFAIYLLRINPMIRNLTLWGIISHDCLATYPLFRIIVKAYCEQQSISLAATGKWFTCSMLSDPELTILRKALKGGLKGVVTGWEIISNRQKPFPSIRNHVFSMPTHP